MLEMLQSTFGNIAVPFFSAVVGGIVSTFLAHSRFKKEWWWQRKAEVYSKLIYALHESLQFSEVHLNASITQTEVTDEQEIELRKKAKESRSQINQIKDTGIFFLSDKAIERLKQFTREESAATETASWEEHLDLDIAATSSCLTEIIDIAKSELNSSWIYQKY